MSRWFRFYDDVLDDPKVQRLPSELFKVWVNILCLASRNGGYLPPIGDIWFSLRLCEKDARKHLDALAAAGLLDTDGETLHPHNWSGRQFSSDVSKDRVKRHRERKKAATSNDDVTLHVTPPEAEAETEAEASTASRGEFAAGKPTLESPPPNDLDRAQAACCAALGEQAPADLVIGPMLEIFEKFGEKRVIATLRSEGRRPRKKPVKTWRLWATIVDETLANSAGSAARPEAVKAHDDPSDPAIALVDRNGRETGVVWRRSQIAKLVEQWKANPRSWPPGWWPPGHPHCLFPRAVLVELGAIPETVA